MNERGLSFSPIIALPEERREFIRGRAREYQERLQRWLTPVQRLDLQYKLEIMQGLLQESRINTLILGEEIKRRSHHAFKPDIFFNACDVVNDLAQNGGVNITDDRGLPRVVRKS